MAKTTETAKTTKTLECLNGAIPKNKRQYYGAVVLLHPEFGFIRIAFGDGGNLNTEEGEDEQTDDQGNKIDAYMYITTYKMEANDNVWHSGAVTLDDWKTGKISEKPGVSGLLFMEDDGGCMLFSTKTHKTGNILPMLEPSLDFMGWPTELEEYVFISKED